MSNKKIKHVEALADDLIDVHIRETLSSSSREQISKYMAERIRWWVGDILHLAKNIRETSANESDRQARLIEMEENTGVPKTHLL